jgi:hypothetical protein
MNLAVDLQNRRLAIVSLKNFHKKGKNKVIIFEKIKLNPLFYE